jgi:hypothetical protein
VTQASLGKAVFEPPVLAFGCLSINEQAQALDETELFETRHLQLLLEALDHPGQLQHLELLDRRLSQHGFCSAPP